jgi:hypothetical protein
MDGVAGVSSDQQENSDLQCVGNVQLILREMEFMWCFSGR